MFSRRTARNQQLINYDGAYRREKNIELMFENLLVIVAHPDDEVLGCGGTVAKFSDQGASVHIAFLAHGGACGVRPNSHAGMLDAEGYPHAYLDIGQLRLEFSRVARKADQLFADVIISRTHVS